jgi:phospholipase D1/2
VLGFIDCSITHRCQLRRPAALFPEWRLDRLLQRKAEQGVRIYVMVYKEVTASMALSSKHTKVGFVSLEPAPR